MILSHTQAKEVSQHIAESILKKVAPDLKIRPDLSQLKFDKVKKSLLGSHVLYQQQHKGKPISGAWVRVDIDKDGRVYNIHNDLVPETIIEKSKEKRGENKANSGVAVKELSADEAKNRAIEATGPLATARMKCWITSWFIFLIMVLLL